VKALLDANANPNFKDKITLRTPLMDAAASGDTESVKLLLDKKALPNLKDKAGMSALQEAVVHGDTDMVKAMLDKGADPNVKDANNRTPLMEVAAKGDADLIVALKEKKVDLNAPDKNGRTALMEAVTSGNQKAVAALVGSPDYNYKPPFVDLKKNKQGDMALALAKQALQQPTIDTFDKSEGKPGITAYERQNYEAIVEMLEKAATPKKP
jgi:ankyrin repeat protein